MHLDLATAMIITSTLTLAVGAALAVAVSHYPDQVRKAMHIWIRGLLLQIPVFLMFGLVSGPPDTTWVVLANALFALAYVDMGRAARLLASGRGRIRRSDLVLVAALIAVPIVFGFLWPSPRWRLAIGAPLLAALSLSVAASIFVRGSAPRSAAYLTGGLFVISAVPMLLRAAIELAPASIDVELARAFTRNLFFLTGSSLPLIGTIGFLLMCNDRINDELARLAMLDPLTGVFNRRTFDSHAAEAIANAIRLRLPLSLLALDIDHFKRVNDELGHDVGDRALRSVVDLLRASLGDGEILSRIGGEEFAVLVPGADETDAAAIAERLRRDLENSTIDVDGRPLTLRISLGVASLAPERATLPALLRAADRALYAAKRSGRNRVALSSELLSATG